jgi:hypothetical protein
MTADDVTLTDIMAGAPVPFTVDGTGYQVRQPTGEEYDDANYLYSRAYAKAMADPDIKTLKSEPCSDGERALYATLADLAEQLGKAAPADSAERGSRLADAARLRQLVQTRTAAEELAHDRALLVKERWLCVHLLLDEHGRPLFDPQQPGEMARWQHYSLRVKEAARPAIRRVLRMVEEAPFASATPPG